MFKLFKTLDVYIINCDQKVFTYMFNDHMLPMIQQYLPI